MNLYRVQHSGRLRSGFSLVELVIVISLTSLVLLVAMSLLRGVATWGDRALDSEHRAEEVFRFEQTLRQQLRQATNVSAAEKTMTIEFADGRAEWTLAGDHCLVRTTRGGEIRNQRFDIGHWKERGPGQKGDPWQQWRVSSDGGLTEVALQPAENLPSRVFRVVAATSQPPREPPTDEPPSEGPPTEEAEE